MEGQKRRVMNSNDLLTIFKNTGGYITGSHIVYTSGKHGEAYLNKDAIYPHTKEISKICLEIAKRFKGSGIEVVAAPALGGIILSQWTAYHLSNLTGRDVLGIYTEKTPDKNQIFTRGYGILVEGKKVLILEDVTNTGGSVVKVIKSVKDAGGKIVSVCVIANRDPDNVNAITLGVPFVALAEIKMEAWEEKDCKLCRENVPINTTVGKGREYLTKNSKF